MALGSSKARELFPRLLQLVEQYPDTMELMIKKVKKVPSIRPYVHTTRNLITAPSSFFFSLSLYSKSSSIPCWMFIGWINQMIALVDKPECRAVHDILLRIAEAYPQVSVHML